MKKKVIIIIIVLVIVGISSIFIFKKVKKEKAATGGSSGAGTGSGTSQATKFPLKKGSTGDAVKKVQEGLNTINRKKLSYTDLVVDGIFGTKTETALNDACSLKELTKARYEKFLECVGKVGENGFTVTEKILIQAVL